MTNTADNNGAEGVLAQARPSSGAAPPDAEPVLDITPLPLMVHATLAFVRRLPSQRVVDQLAKLDPTPFGELQDQQPSRVTAFRCLLRDYPDRDFASLWMHAYDCEVELDEVDPTFRPVPTLLPISAPTST
jgi:hypothetical protein